MATKEGIQAELGSIGISLTDVQLETLTKGEPVELNNLSLSEMGTLLKYAEEITKRQGAPRITVGDLKSASVKPLGDGGRCVGITIKCWGEDRPGSTYCCAYLGFPDILCVSCRTQS